MSAEYAGSAAPGEKASALPVENASPEFPVDSAGADGAEEFCCAVSGWFCSGTPKDISSKPGVRELVILSNEMPPEKLSFEFVFE